ncbi:RNA-binding protein 5-B-like protein [Leptotrombidium deliense]|uniref:RNA-binding protein 5-B-like protein n=1 Tax=Leptotrombidium deliense TaxID=299467 RepID=A0A443SND6_9ACAR|nr:RNA-binding protein 5-B-like protein [Leptotrombidium deliense]
MGGSKERERERSRSERDRRYRESRHKDRDKSYPRSPDYYSSEDDSFYDETRRNRNRDHSSWRSRRERSRSRDRERNKHEDDEFECYDADLDRDRAHLKREEAPNNTLMIRGLAPHVTENDIILKLKENALQAKDIRLMRKKETAKDVECIKTKYRLTSGASRGFAFVEFSNLSDAIRWKDLTQGVVTFDQCQATLHYSIPKDVFGVDRGLIQKYDWTCYKCGVNNFKRREQCFKCGTPREESAVNDRGDEISATPTNCNSKSLLLHNVSPHTVEERILTVLGTITSLPIKSIRIPKDTVYGLSRGICFVELHTTLEASQLFTLLSSLNPGFIVDDYPLTVSYAKRNMPSSHLNACAVNAASVALAAAQWTNQSENQIVSTVDSQSSSLQKYTTQFDEKKSLGTVTINGVVYQKYPPPDTSKYQYDSTSGFYYDPSTGLYYDSKSHYYYNSATQTYLYWNNEYETYLPPDTDFSATGDMEKWAKTLNQKKETKLVPTAVPQNSGSSNNESLPVNLFNETSNDSVTETLNVVDRKLEKKDSKKNTESINPDDICFESSDVVISSPSQDPASIIEAEELRLTDWEKLLCLLCKRQFTSKEQLVKHQQLSELHKSNLEVVKRSKLTDEQIAELKRKEASYRDRAKERRLKYGIPETPEPNKLKDKFLREEESQQSIPVPIAEDNIGNKMLKAMGWTEGQGLGRSNQGRANIIEVERRPDCAGLGSRTIQATGESYKDAVRRAMQQRFRELSDKE